MWLLEELTPPLRIRILEGDIFAYRIMGVYRYLRAVRDIDMPGKGRMVLYFYRPESDAAERIPELCKEDLLIPPVITWREVLRDGFSLRVAQRPLEEGVRYQHHCFDTEWQSGGGPYRDEFGKPLESRFEPCGSVGMPLSLNGLEYDLGLALGLIHSREELHAMPPQPRPLLRAARAGRLPHRHVVLMIPDFTSKHLERLSLRLSRKEKEREGHWGVPANAVALHIERCIMRLPGFSSVASPAPLGIDVSEEQGLVSLQMAVKKRQHREFYKYIDRAMSELEIDRYCILDSELLDWLHGTYKPTDVQPL